MWLNDVFLGLPGLRTGITAQSDFSCTCMSAVRFMAFADRSCSFEQDVQEISRLLSLRPDDLLTILKMALSIDLRDSVSILPSIQATRF